MTHRNTKQRSEILIKYRQNTEKHGKHELSLDQCEKLQKSTY